MPFARPFQSRLEGEAAAISTNVTGVAVSMFCLVDSLKLRL